MRREFRNILSISIIFFATVSSAAEKEIALAELPAVVMAAVTAEKPGIEITEASVEIEDNASVYELEGKADGKEYEIEVTTDGKILELEEGD